MYIILSRISQSGSCFKSAAQNFPPIFSLLYHQLYTNMLSEQHIKTLTLLKVWDKLVNNLLHSTIGAARKTKPCFQLIDAAFTRLILNHIQRKNYLSQNSHTQIILICSLVCKKLYISYHLQYDHMRTRIFKKYLLIPL